MQKKKINSHFYIFRIISSILFIKLDATKLECLPERFNAIAVFSTFIVINSILQACIQISSNKQPMDRTKSCPIF